jgi:large subunit ribosomal protein L2
MAAFCGGGRNVHGRITNYHRGGTRPRRHYQFDFEVSFSNMPAIVIRYDVDACRRGGRVALIFFCNGFFSYILAPSNLQLNSFLLFGTNAPNTKVGNVLSLGDVNQGSYVFNIQSIQNRPFIFSRSAGTSCLILVKDSKYNCSVLRLPSGEHRIISNKCFVTIGSVSNSSHKFERFSSAGQRRRIGFRPVVRGTAMNPIDHPHGGGAGKTSGGRPSVSPWGFITKGKPTVNTRRKSIVHIVRSRKLCLLVFRVRKNTLILYIF